MFTSRPLRPHCSHAVQVYMCAEQPRRQLVERLTPASDCCARFGGTAGCVRGLFRICTLPPTGAFVINTRFGLHRSHGHVSSLALSLISRLTSAYTGFSDLRVSAKPRSPLVSPTMLTSALIPFIYEFRSIARLYDGIFVTIFFVGRP